MGPRPHRVLGSMVLIIKAGPNKSKDQKYGYYLLCSLLTSRGILIHDSNN